MRHFGVWGTVSSGFLKAEATDFLKLLAFEMNLLLKDFPDGSALRTSTTTTEGKRG